jgi:hypothetical protein
MASANLDVVRSICADWERGDFSRADWAHHEIEYVIADGPTPGAWKGLDGMMEGSRDFPSAWENWRGDVEVCRALDSERVLVLIGGTGRGKASGVDATQMQWKGANVFHLDGGKVTRLVVYFDRERALADLGLAREGDTP